MMYRSLCALSLLLGGCLVENLCDRSPELAECHAVPMDGPAQLLTRRLPLSGGDLSVRVMGMPASVEAVLSPRGMEEKRLALRLDADGQWHVNLRPLELWAAAAPGPIPVKLVTPNQSSAATLRLYVPPSFGPDVSRSAKIVWLSIVNRHVIALEQGATDRTFGDWTYQPPLLIKGASVPLSLAFTVPATAVFGCTESAFVRLIPNGSSWQLQQSPLGELRYTDIESSLDYSSVVGLAVGKRGAANLLAVAGEGGAGSALRAYRLPDGGAGAATRLMVSPVPAPLALVAAGSLDANDEVDLISIGKDGVASVWLGAATALSRDDSLSRSLTMQLGSGAVRALAVGDLDRDGLGDVIVSRSSELSWLTNLGDGGFAAPASLIALPDNATTLDVGPIDGNDSPDVAVGIQAITMIGYLNQAQ